MDGSGYVVAVFGSTHDAMRAQRGLQGQVMPTPRGISASCGISVRLSPEEAARAQALLRELGIEGRLYAVAQDGTAALL